ncbi:hypothetical protein NIES208_18010 [[Limnothrix rosea] IAM M-220]|nr:hypothetical protein NIES208_18010 [[Limnothrix rosea] IAM M-220]
MRCRGQKNLLPMVLITGMAGVGKSELALQYAKLKRQNEEFAGRYAYLSAANFVEDLQDFLMRSPILETPRLMDCSQPKTKAQAAWELWAEYCEEVSGQGLIVIDDVTSYGQQIRDFLPKQTAEKSPFRFVLTSRDRWEDLPFFELEELSLGAAKRMFCNAVGERHQNRVEGQMATVESLCRRLGCLPLALALTGSWLGVADAGRTLTDLITALEAADLEQAPLQPNPLATRKVAEQGLKAAFQVSWEQLPQLDASAQQLARVLGLFAPVDVPWELVKMVAEAYPVELPPVPPPRRSLFKRLWDWLRSLFGDRLESEIKIKRPIQPIRNLSEARWALTRTSLLRTLQPNETYRVHPLLHEFFQLQWNEKTDRQGWEMAFGKGLSRKAEDIPQEPTWEQLENLRPLRPHFDKAIDLLTALRKNKNNYFYKALQRRFYEQLSSCQTGVARLSQLPIFIKTHTQAQKKYQVAKNSLKQGQQETAEKEFEEAIALYETAIAQGRQALGENSLILANYLYKLADIFFERGRFVDGISYAKEAIKVAEAKASPKTLANYLNTLGLLYDKQHQYPEAESCYQRALSIREQIFGKNSVDIVQILINLGRLQTVTKKFPEAKRLYQRALSIRKKQWGGADHTDIADILNHFAAFYIDQRLYVRAEPFCQQSLEIHEAVLEKNNPNFAEVLNNFAVLCDNQRKYSRAKSLYLRSIEVTEKYLGNMHPLVAHKISNLGVMYYKQGKYFEAQELMLRSLKIRQKTLGKKHPETRYTQRWLDDIQSAISKK